MRWCPKVVAQSRWASCRSWRSSKSRILSKTPGSSKPGTQCSSRVAMTGRRINMTLTSFTTRRIYHRHVKKDNSKRWNRQIWSLSAKWGTMQPRYLIKQAINSRLKSQERTAWTITNMGSLTSNRSCANLSLATLRRILTAPQAPIRIY